MDFANFEGWTGDASELARLAGEIIATRGLVDTSAEPNVRLIRDYAQRGIVSRAERHGKKATKRCSAFSRHQQSCPTDTRSR